MTEIGRSTRETGLFELSGSPEPRPMLDKIALAIDFLTPRATICFCRSDLALAEPFLGDAVSLTQPVHHMELFAYLNNSTTVDLAVSRTELSASSKHATSEGTYCRNNKPWFFVIW
jgi:hypothetical protein